MKKSTPKGHCQICCKLHKLPNDRLSDHGYTIEGRFGGMGGYFSGVCRGSSALPFERDNSLVIESIAQAKKQAIECRALSDKWMNAVVDINECKIYHHPDRYTRGYYITGKLYQGENGVSYNFSDVTYVVRHRGHTPEAVANHCNSGYAHECLARAKQLDMYVVFQEERLTKWVPDAPLIPNEKERAA